MVVVRASSADALDDAGRDADVPAAIVDRPGAEPRFGRVGLPARVPGTTRLAVVAAPLNPLDLLIASGGFHSARYDVPYVPGSECVGTVVASDRYPAGALVYAECLASPERPGAFAAEALVDDENVLVLPEGLDPVGAAAVGNSGVAAFVPLVDVAGLRARDRVLVLGATGAVGRLAVQIAHLRGAGRVTGVARDVAALERLRGLGADAVVGVRDGETADSLAARIIDLAGPVDVVLDCLYGVPLEAALHACAPRARIVNVGHSAGPTARIPAGLLRGKQLSVVGFAGLHTPFREKHAALTWLWRQLGRGKLRTHETSVSFEGLPTAWRAQSSSPHTKFVVLP